MSTAQQAPSAQDRSYPYLQDRTFRQVVHPSGDPQIGNLDTPINSSGFAKAFIQNLPAYRRGLSPFRRALEVGMAHGYWLIGPFVKLGPLRDAPVALLAGVLSALGLILISTIGLSLYAGSNPPKPMGHPAAAAPNGLENSDDWNEYAGGFLIGGFGGAVLAAALLWAIDQFQGISL